MLDQVKKIGLNLKKSKIAILGLAYKPGTNSIKNSPSVELIKNLRNSVLNLHDPLVQNHSTQKNTIFFSNPLSAIKGCDALIVMTPWQQYKRLPLEKICKLLKKPNIIDPYRIFDHRKILRKKINYYAIGIKC